MSAASRDELVQQLNAAGVVARWEGEEGEMGETLVVTFASGRTFRLTVEPGYEDMFVVTEESER